MALDQLAHATVALRRTQVVLIFTFAMPLVWLVLIGLLAGNDAVGADGLRVMQFAAPTAIAMGTFFATMPSVAIAVADARETGVLKRLRGTPLPAAAYFLGQVGAAVVFAMASLILTLLLSVVLYQVQLRPETLLASVVTLLLGVISFSAVGLAIGSISRSAAMAEAVAIGAAVVLSFISGLFLVGATLPGWLDAIARVFPLKPYASLLQDQFDPFVDGDGWDAGRLAIVAAWGLVGALVTIRAFRWEPHRQRVARPARRGADASAERGMIATSLRPAAGPRPSVLALIAQQAGSALRTTWRRPGDVFFSLLMPVALFALLVAVLPADAFPDGRPASAVVAASMVAWGVGVILFMNLAEQVSRARDRGLLKRMRGTPLPVSAYLVGRTVAGIALALLVLVSILTLGALAFQLRVDALGLLLGVGTLLLGAIALAACGFLLVTLVPSARAVGAVGLVILFVLAFFSDIFLASGPEWMGAVGSLFPLKHLQNALAAAWAPTASTTLWLHLLVLAAWAAGAGSLVVGRFRRAVALDERTHR